MRLLAITLVVTATSVGAAGAPAPPPAVWAADLAAGGAVPRLNCSRGWSQESHFPERFGGGALPVPDERFELGPLRGAGFESDQR